MGVFFPYFTSKTVQYTVKRPEFLINSTMYMRFPNNQIPTNDITDFTWSRPFSTSKMFRFYSKYDHKEIYSLSLAGSEPGM